MNYKETLEAMRSLETLAESRAEDYADARHLTRRCKGGPVRWVACERPDFEDTEALVEVAEDINYDARMRRMIRLSVAQLEMDDTDWRALLASLEVERDREAAAEVSAKKHAKLQAARAALAEAERELGI